MHNKKGLAFLGQKVREYFKKKKKELAFQA